MSHDLANLAKLVLRTGSLRMAFFPALDAPQLVSLGLLLHVLEFFHHPNHILLEGADLLATLFVITAFLC